MRHGEFIRMISNLLDSKEGESVTMTYPYSNGVRIVNDGKSLLYHTSSITIRFSDAEPILDGIMLLHSGRSVALLENRHIKGLEVL